MKTLRNILLTMALLSCDGTQAIQDLEPPPDELYICYSPETPEHGKLCTEECLSSPQAYCWLITRKNCNRVHQYEWQKENCHFFD